MLGGIELGIGYDIKNSLKKSIFGRKFACFFWNMPYNNMGLM